ncbi:MAG TPA: hypothetical protein VNP90_03840 [Actinomycetota bacterium]|nr:hypothetical protein [Actinomycetota bacterium]
MSEYQEEVLTNLLDLQAELRGDEPEPHDERPAEASADPQETNDAATSPEAVAVIEGGVTVSSSSRPSTNGIGVNERLAALNDRLARLEYDLVGVTKRIERIEPDAGVDSVGSADPDVDARWRSFLDLQKIVANRLDAH